MNSTYDNKSSGRPGYLGSFRPETIFTGPRQEVSGDRFIKRRGRPTRPRWLVLFKRLRPSRITREARSYEALQKIGVPCPGNIRVREERNFLGLLNSSRISMDFMANTVDLKYLNTLDSFALIRSNTAWRRKVIRRIAVWVRHMHDHNYFDSKLHFGNILVVPDPDADDPEIYFIDVAGGHKGIFARKNHLRMKDIAYLYHDALRWCTPRERVFFMHEFLGTSKLSPADRLFIRRIIRYAERKFKKKKALS
jgi:tRNA A-37 threonylcarbamoyl transferase component Bud32